MVFPYIGEQTSAPQTASAKAEPQHWYTSAEWWLFILSIPTLIVLGWQAKETRRAAEAARDSIRLQEAQFDQAVNLTNWRTNEPKENRLEIRVDLVNPTAFHMTLNDSYIRFRRFVDQDRKCTEYGTGNNVFLPPNLPFTVNIGIALGATEQGAQSLSFSVTARFSHRHRVTKREIVQELEGRLDCAKWQVDKKWHAVFTPLVHMNPIQEPQRPGRQDPN